MAYDKIEPIGDGRLDYLFAAQTHHLHAMWLEGYDGKPADFLPKWGTDPEAEEAEPQNEARSILNRLHQMHWDTDG